MMDENTELGTAKATELGKTCTTCFWFEITTTPTGWSGHEIEVECGRSLVSWHTDLSPKECTEYEAGLSYCPEWETKTRNDKE